MQKLLRSCALQAKLSVNQPGDRFEQEADRVADAVMRMPDPSAATPPHVQRKCCSQCEEELHRKEASSAQPAQSSFQLPGGMGQPLPDSERRFFEPRFGRDLSSLRVHTDEQAAASARTVSALAYTSGRDIVFGAGQFQPGTTTGRKLLAHEITHTFQQRGAGEPAIQRTIGDGHDLTSPRFSGDLVLEAVYDNERLLRFGNRGSAVRTLQQALVDAGFLLPRFGVDGIFGAETKTAVEEFQRASGLTGANIDGIVGPTTMGWLDQRFSAGPTPAGGTPSASTGCAAIKTVNIDIVSLDGSTRPPTADLEFANTVFNQCCVRFALAGGGSESPARTTTMLGGDTDLNNTPFTCASATAEETALFTGATSDFGLSSKIRVFYVASLANGDRAYSIFPSCATAGKGLSGMAAVTNSGLSRSLAHELGHILLDTGAHPPAGTDTNNLMEPTNTATGEQLRAPQCATIFAAA
jgi:peptidoglycan hydrolase-like protein with peptidoglycan-binding domain